VSGTASLSSAQGSTTASALSGDTASAEDSILPPDCSIDATYGRGRLVLCTG